MNRTMASSLGKMATTSVRRLISPLRRSIYGAIGGARTVGPASTEPYPPLGTRTKDTKGRRFGRPFLSTSVAAASHSRHVFRREPVNSERKIHPEGTDAVGRRYFLERRYQKCERSPL